MPLDGAAPAAAISASETMPSPSVSTLAAKACPA